MSFHTPNVSDRLVYFFLSPLLDLIRPSGESKRYLTNNKLTTLPDGVFDGPCSSLTEL